MKRCRWCGALFGPRPGEGPARFAKRKTCDRSCAVSLQNHNRAKENRRARRRGGETA